MSLPLSYPEPENAVIGYLSINGFAKFDGYAKTRAEAA